MDFLGGPCDLSSNMILLFYLLTILLKIKTVLNILVNEPFSRYLDVLHSTFSNDRQGLQGYNSTILSGMLEVL